MPGNPVDSAEVRLTSRRGSTMKLMTQRLLGLALATAFILSLAACGAGEASAGEKTADKTKQRAVSDAKRKSEPAPPADYVRARCTACSCRVYTGETGYCRRPGCKHHWKDHQRPPQG